MARQAITPAFVSTPRAAQILGVSAQMLRDLINDSDRLEVEYPPICFRPAPGAQPRWTANTSALQRGVIRWMNRVQAAKADHERREQLRATTAEMLKVEAAKAQAAADEELEGLLD